jgi:hypothetical protein
MPRLRRAQCSYLGRLHSRGFVSALRAELRKTGVLAPTAIGRDVVVSALRAVGFSTDGLQAPAEGSAGRARAVSAEASDAAHHRGEGVLTTPPVAPGGDGDEGQGVGADADTDDDGSAAFLQQGSGRSRAAAAAAAAVAHAAALPSPSVGVLLVAFGGQLLQCVGGSGGSSTAAANGGGGGGAGGAGDSSSSGGHSCPPGARGALLLAVAILAVVAVVAAAPHLLACARGLSEQVGGFSMPAVALEPLGAAASEKTSILGGGA